MLQFPSGQTQRWKEKLYFLRAVEDSVSRKRGGSLWSVSATRDPTEGGSLRGLPQGPHHSTCISLLPVKELFRTDHVF